MSASTIPTDRPWRAIDAARFTVSEDLPTPPLPDATANTLVSESGQANRISFSATPPRSWVWRGALFVRHHPELDLDAGHAGQLRSGRGGVAAQGVLHRAAGDREQDPDGDHAAVPDVHGVDHAQLGDRLLDLGIEHDPSAVVTCSTVGDMLSRLRGVPSPVRRESSSTSSDFSSDRRKSRVATSPSAIRSDAISRARYSMSARARSSTSRSRSYCTSPGPPAGSGPAGSAALRTTPAG